MHPNRKDAVMRRPLRRRGYALMLVLFFIVLFMSLLSVAWRRMASALRIASVHATQIHRDEGSINAMARAMRLLETGLPPSTPYVCSATITTSQGPRRYTVTFTLASDGTWSVHSTPTLASENPLPMPDTFAPSHS